MKTKKQKKTKCSTGIYQGHHVYDEHNDGNSGQTGPNNLNAQQSHSTRGTDSKASFRSDTYNNGTSGSSFNLSSNITNNLSGSTGNSSVLSTNAGGDGPTPPMPHRRLAKSFSVSNSTTTKGGNIVFFFGLFLYLWHNLPAHWVYLHIFFIFKNVS